MKADTAINQLKEKFKSNNDVPVTKADITLEEFKALEALVDDTIMMYNDMKADNLL